MDTDDLTPMANQTLSLCFDVCNLLRSEIGASAAGFKTEDEFLRGRAGYLNSILDDPEGYLDSWDLLDEINLKSFKAGLRRVQAHIPLTLKTPREQRDKPPFGE
jgi:hypothetical protein